MNEMRTLFYKLPRTIAECFRGYNLVWQFLAMIITYGLVISGFDWFYFQSTRGSELALFLFPAVILGGFLPVIVPLLMLAIGSIRKNLRTVNTAWALGQAGIIGLLVSSFYKAFTGRVPPEHIQSTVNVFRRALTGTMPYAPMNTVIDISREFRFGFMRGGIFWGWPSSHTTVAFATAVTVLMLYPKNQRVRYFALLYAVYVGLGVSISIHWFSEVIAGIIFGAIIGVVVGKSFFSRCSIPASPSSV